MGGAHVPGQPGGCERDTVNEIRTWDTPRNTVDIRPASEIRVSAYKLPYFSAYRPGDCYILTRLLKEWEAIW